MALIFIFGLLTILSGINCRVFDILPKSSGKQLFLSRRVVTDSSEFDGGVLVSETGIIEAVLERDVVNSILALNHDLKIIDGGNLALMAGVVDSHVHVNEPGRTSWEGYVTATQAAAAGGVTTICDMPLNSIPPTTTLENLKVKANIAREEVFVDVGFWGGIVPGNQDELQNLINAGVVGFKCFLTNSGVAEFPMVTKSDVAEAFKVLNGTGTVFAFHAELSENDKKSSECSGPDCPDPILYSTYLASRPEEMELDAVSLITSFLPQTDVHVHVVHVSAEGVVPILEQARNERIKAGYKGWRGGVTAETCNHYLTLSSEMIPPGHSEYKCSPPVRNITNKLQLWEYIKDRRLDLVTSDHSPSVAELKGANFMTAWGGISSVQFDLPLFWTEAKARGHSLSTASHYLSAGPARLAGLQDRKGAIRPGLDADLIFFDPDATFIVTPEIIRYKNKISPYMYRVLSGKVTKTYLRGQLIFEDDDLVEGPKGQLLLNEGTEYVISQDIQALRTIETDFSKAKIQVVLNVTRNIKYDSRIKEEQIYSQGKETVINKQENKGISSKFDHGNLVKLENNTEFDIKNDTANATETINVIQNNKSNNLTRSSQNSEAFASTNESNYMDPELHKTVDFSNSSDANVTEYSENNITAQKAEDNYSSVHLDDNGTATSSMPHTEKQKISEEGKRKRLILKNNTSRIINSGILFVLIIVHFST